ncbi:hypothetical protein WICPIJ_003718 [Wickerhamomyces pijperi]|uniref:Uncharacterized protein n=1 Tax=Wickerhamomyces pijperi TaxID=599730 RepID=A0A9P8Q927_WICPI|nr:hypothetical protein WICPIJ_003718 [Wickerhamomyces pijperi]
MTISHTVSIMMPPRQTATFYYNLDAPVSQHKPIPPSWRLEVLKSRQLTLESAPEISDFKVRLIHNTANKESIHSSSSGGRMSHQKSVDNLQDSEGHSSFSSQSAHSSSIATGSLATGKSSTSSLSLVQNKRYTKQLTGSLEAAFNLGDNIPLGGYENRQSKLNHYDVLPTA